MRWQRVQGNIHRLDKLPINNQINLGRLEFIMLIIIELMDKHNVVELRSLVLVICYVTHGRFITLIRARNFFFSSSTEKIQVEVGEFSTHRKSTGIENFQGYTIFLFVYTQFPKYIVCAISRFKNIIFWSSDTGLLFEFSEASDISGTVVATGCSFLQVNWTHI